MIRDILIMFTVSLCLTLLIETVVFLLLRGKKKDLFILFPVNILTNPVVVYLCFLTRRYLSDLYIPVQILLEILVVITEGFLYRSFSVKTGKIKNPFVLSLILNGISYLSGIVINMIT